MDAVPRPASPRSEVKRLPERARYDRATVNAILDEGLVAHVGIAQGGAPVVIPTAYVRLGDELYLHGSPASRLLRARADGSGFELVAEGRLQLTAEGLELGAEQLAHSELTAVSVELGNQVQHGRFDGHIQRSGWLVHNQQSWIRKERHSKHDSLLLPAGELMWIALHHPRRVRHGDALKQFQASYVGGIFAEILVHSQNFLHLVPYAHRRV